MSSLTAIRSSEPIPTPVLRPLNLPAAPVRGEESFQPTWQNDGFSFNFVTPPAPANAPPPFQAGNRVQLFIGDHETYRHALQMIESARSSIQFESFTFNADQARGIAAALIRARKRGVNVQVVLDYKSMFLAGQRSIAKDMLHNGIDVREYQARNLNSPLIAIDHAKMLLIDGQRALVGGTNFDRRVNYDINFEVAGPAIPELAKKFVESQANSKPIGKPGHVSAAPSVAVMPVPVGTPVPGGLTEIAITQTQPKKDMQLERQTLPYVLAALRDAKTHIDLLMYKMDSDEQLAALEDAHKRGVKVRVLINNDFYNQYAASRLHKAGVPVMWFKPPAGFDELHAKIAIFDREKLLGGTHNWVHASNYDNHELAVWLKGHGVTQVQELFDGLWQNQSTPIGKFSRMDRVKAWAIDHLDFVF